MNEKELDKLLKDSMQKEFPVPKELDRNTSFRMKQVSETRVYHFTSILIMISTALTGLGLAIFWQFDPGLLYKCILSMVCFSLFTFFLLLYIINYQTHARKEINI